MIRRNQAGQVYYFPVLVLTATGAPVTSGATLTVAKDGVEAASLGTLTHHAGGVWKYYPTQAETDCVSMAWILVATDAMPVVMNFVTTAANTAAVALGALEADGAFVQQSRHRLGIDGTKDVPASSNPSLGDVTMAQLSIDSSATTNKTAIEVISKGSTKTVEIRDTTYTFNPVTLNMLSGETRLNSIVGTLSGSVSGNITGKVLGGGAGTITGTGVQSQLPDNAITDAKIATGAFTAAKFAAGAFDAVWTVAARTLTTAADSAGITTLLTRITGLLRTKAEDEVVDAAITAEINEIPTVNGDATQAKQDIIIDALNRNKKTQY